MEHLNNNILASVGIRTRGVQADCELIELTVIPINYQLKYDEKFSPLQLKIQPTEAEPMDLKPVQYEKKSHCNERSEARLVESMKVGIDPIAAAGYFQEWFDHLNLRMHCRIIPIVYDWETTAFALYQWIGWENLKHFFSSYVRDIMVISAWENDLAGYRHRAYPMGRLEFSGVCSRLGVTRQSVEGKISATANAVATYECYLKLLSLGMHDPSFIDKLREEME